jgi:hypothetical protein
MIGPLKMTGETNIANIFTAFRDIGRRNFIFREDGSKWTFGNARTTVNAGVRVNIDPRPFIHREAGNHAFYRTNVNTTAVANA